MGNSFFQHLTKSVEKFNVFGRLLILCYFNMWHNFVNGGMKYIFDHVPPV